MPCLANVPTGMIIDPDAGRGDGTIYVSSIVTGKSLAKITASSQAGEASESGSSSSSSSGSSSSSSSSSSGGGSGGRSGENHSMLMKKRKALQGITALFYNEEQNEIYTGNKSGAIHLWG